MSDQPKPEGPPGFAPRITPSSDAEWLGYYRREAQRLQAKVIAKEFECSAMRGDLNDIADALRLPHGVTRQKSIVSMIMNRIAELDKKQDNNETNEP